MYISDWYPTLTKLANLDPTDDWIDPTTNLTHPIDGVDVWESLTTGHASTHEYLPTTEDSLIWNAGDGRIWKLVSQEFQANRFYQNGSQYMDPYNPCIANASDVARPNLEGGVQVPKSCVVCSPAHPCLYDLQSDALEMHNVAKANPDIVTKLMAKLSTYVPYVPPLSAENLACYNCAVDPDKYWDNYVGPCCLNKY